MAASDSERADPMLDHCRQARIRHRGGLEAAYRTAHIRLQAVIEAGEAGPATFCELANHHARAGNHQQAIDTCRHGLRQHPDDTTLLPTLVRLLRDTGEAEQALVEAREAARRNPGEPALVLAHALLLPSLYADQAQMPRWRRHFAVGLSRVEGLISRCQEQGHAALDALISALPAPFFLAGLGCAGIELQRWYGRLVADLMAARYPHLTRPRPHRHRSGGDPVRIGYLSPNLCRGSVAKVSGGWIRHHDPERFSVHCYHLGHTADEITAQLARHATAFHHLPLDRSGNNSTQWLQAICSHIVADDLDVLVLVDIGMSPVMTRLAGLRLAPVQCSTWAHPVSSGSPCVDLFISGELLEPPDGQDHYSEELVRLPNLGTCYARPVVPRPLLSRQRADFGLEAGTVAILCCQPSWKYLPEDDWILAAIAAAAANVRFVFTPENLTVGERLLRRLDAAFAAAGLDRRRFCVLPRREHAFGDRFLTPLEFWNLCLVCDALLDTPGWSAGITALEAVACGLPVITLPGELARGRQAAAVLSMAGATETIAASQQELVTIAAHLGCDQEWRGQVRSNLSQRARLVFDDTSCLGALEEVYLRVG